MTGVGTKRAIGAFPPSPSAYTEDAVFSQLGGDAELRCTYERDGAIYSGALQFLRVHAFRHRAEIHCTNWHIEDAYDTLVEIDESEWVKELVAAEPSQTSFTWTIRHFLIFIDSAGAYEVAAEDYGWLPEQASA